MPDENEGNPLFEFLAELRVTLGGMNDEVRMMRHERARARANETPGYIRMHGQVLTDANGFGVIGFDNPGPTSGYYWHIRKLVVGRDTPTTVAQGQADVFVTAGDLRSFDALSDFGIMDWQDQAVEMPLIGPYGDGELTLKYPEKLYLVISGGTPAVNYYCAGTAKIVQDSSPAQSVAV